jgi:tetratricopeptide (TPR) repeat protein
MIKNILLSIIVILALSSFFACASTEKSPVSIGATNGVWNAQKLLIASKDSAFFSMETKDRSAAKKSALLGVEHAERCLMSDPENAGCYYWRAINTGLYYQLHIVGYQNGIRRMISDCDRVIKIEPEYDHGGAYRVLGQLYTKLPQTGVRPDSITRDLDLAENYLRQAIRLAPTYPENHLALADTLFEKGNFKEAADEIAEARNSVPHWKSDASYQNWGSEIIGMEKKIARTTK